MRAVAAAAAPAGFLLLERLAQVAAAQEVLLEMEALEEQILATAAAGEGLVARAVTAAAAWSSSRIRPHSLHSRPLMQA